jgi:hypothetical protein
VRVVVRIILRMGCLSRGARHFESYMMSRNGICCKRTGGSMGQFKPSRESNCERLARECGDEAGVWELGILLEMI